jgi:hypothetical protein
MENDFDGVISILSLSVGVPECVSDGSSVMEGVEVCVGVSVPTLVGDNV